MAIQEQEHGRWKMYKWKSVWCFWFEST